MKTLNDDELSAASGGLAYFEEVDSINNGAATFASGAYGWAALPATPALDMAGLNGYGGVYNSPGVYLQPTLAPTEGVSSINFFTPKGFARWFGLEAGKAAVKRLEDGMGL